MKPWAFLILIFAVVACDPYGFGFKKNPAFVLNEAFKAVSNLDHESFLEVSGKEALCIYGNPEGITYLKENLNIDVDNVKLNPTFLRDEKFVNPQYVGYWSYYHQRYQVEILDKKSKELLIKTIVDCHYGTDEKQNEKFSKLPVEKLKIKDCKLIKVIPTKFKELPLPQKCNELKVVL